MIASRGVSVVRGTGPATLGRGGRTGAPGAVVLVVGAIVEGGAAVVGSADDASGAVEPDEDAVADGGAGDEDGLAMDAALDATGGTDWRHPVDAQAPGPNPTPSTAVERRATRT
jgi:Ni,Fe-hydrogenase III small subunit